MALKISFSEAFVKFDINGDGINNNTLGDYFGYFAQHMSHSKLALLSAFSGSNNPISGYKGQYFGVETNKDNSGTAFVASADQGQTLHYTMFGKPSHTLYGELDNIEMGKGLDKIGAWGTNSNYIQIDGLAGYINNGQNGSDPINRTTGANDVHNIIYGLMNGDTSALTKVLTTAGVDLHQAITHAGTIGYGAATLHEGEVLAA